MHIIKSVGVLSVAKILELELRPHTLNAPYPIIPPAS
jgi:hypothetical protein